MAAGGSRLPVQPAHSAGLRRSTAEHAGRTRQQFPADPELLRRHWSVSTAGLLVASPANPTGTLLTLSEIAALAGVCRANDGHFLVDEIYHGLTYETDAPTACAAGDDIWVINSFSSISR